MKHEVGGRGDHDQFPTVRAQFVQLIGIHGFGDQFVFPLHGVFSGCYKMGIWAADDDAHRIRPRSVQDLRRHVMREELAILHEDAVAGGDEHSRKARPSVLTSWPCAIRALSRVLGTVPCYGGPEFPQLLDAPRPPNRANSMIKPSIILTCAAALAHPAGAEPYPAEVPVKAPGPHGALAGTMLRSTDGKGPVALIIPGSGPTDRDGNNPMGVQAASYRLLAEGLAARGVTTVRADKRGMFGSSSAVSDANAVTIADYVSDTAAWVRVIREQTGASCVWLIGHSEGGLVSLAAAQELGDLCGLVLVATPGKPMGDVIKAQLRANPANAPLIDAADAAIDRLNSGQKVDVSSLPQPLLPLFNPAVQEYLISAFALDPAELAARADLPVLIVQGGKDLQVPVEDASRLKAANPSAVLEILPDANHVLKNVPGDSPADNLATYGEPNLPIAEGIVTAIANFVRG